MMMHVDKMKLCTKVIADNMTYMDQSNFETRVLPEILDWLYENNIHEYELITDEVPCIGGHDGQNSHLYTI